MLHGGGWIRRDRSDMAGKSEQLARHGFAVYNVGYRLAPENQFPAQLEDVYAAQRQLWDLAEKYPILPEQSALMGFSAGAHLALLATARPGDNTPPVQAVVSGAGPTDVSVYPNSPFLIPFLGGKPSEIPKVYEEASPRNYISTNHPPAFLYHGRWDDTVEIAQSRDHYEKLQKAGVESHFYPLRLRGHIGAYLVDFDVFGDIVDFLEKHLGEGKEP